MGTRGDGGGTRSIIMPGHHQQLLSPHSSYITPNRYVLTVLYCTVLCYIFYFYVMSCTYLYCTTAMDTFLYYNHCYIGTVLLCSEMYGTVKLKTLAVSAR